MCVCDEAESALVWVGNKNRPAPKVLHCIRRPERNDNQI